MRWRRRGPDGADTDDLAAAVSAAGMPRAAEIAVRLHDLRHGPLYTRLSSRAADRLGQIIPLLLHHAAERDPADATFERMLGIVRTIAGRSVYFAIDDRQPASVVVIGGFVCCQQIGGAVYRAASCGDR